MGRRDYRRTIGREEEKEQSRRQNWSISELIQCRIEKLEDNREGKWRKEREVCRRKKNRKVEESGDVSG